MGLPESQVSRADALITKADAVLATHTPNPPGVFGFPTLDSGPFSEWRAQSLAFLRSAVGPDHNYVSDFAREVEKGYTSSVKAGQGILRAVRADLAAGHITAEKPTDALGDVRRICNRFHAVASQLRERHDGRPTLDVADEYDVQDVLHALLRLFFEDIRPEEWTGSYAGKSSRMDFLLKAERVVVEAKKARPGLGAKELGSQLIDDIARYGTHPDCDVLVCFVYDPEGRVANPRGFERDLSRTEGALKVEVIVAPKGY